MASNVFSVLVQYASRQEENFLTEAFVHILNTLLENCHEEVVPFLTSICGPNTASWFDITNKISISTQFSVEEGRPDIVIQIGNQSLIFIEVKHDSSLGWKQLERYYSHLQEASFENKQLVLLTRSRHSVQETALDENNFHHVCWYQISGWLSEMKFDDEVSNYMVDQFLEFLKEKEMSMEKVTWEYIEGVPAMINLANMIGTAIAEASPDEKVKRTSGWDWVGYYLGEGTNLWIGIRYNESLDVVYENGTEDSPLFQRVLNLPQAHFFSLSAGEQLEVLIEFIKESLRQDSSR